MRPLIDERRVGSLPLPQIPIQSGRRRRGRKRTADLILAEHDLYRLQLAETALPNHLRGLAKIVIVALPRADLHYAACFLDDFSN